MDDDKDEVENDQPSVEPMQSGSGEIIDDSKREIKTGLGGWLILVGIVVVLTPGIFLLILYSGSQMLSEESRPAMTNHPLFGPLIYSEIILYLCLFFAKAFCI